MACEQHFMLTLRLSLFYSIFYRVFFFSFFFLHFWFSFSRSVFGLICALLNRHLKALTEQNRKLTQLHLPNTCALMSNLQCYFGLHEWHVYFFIFTVSEMTIGHIDMFKQNRWKSTSLVKRESVYHKGIHICIYRGTVHINISYTSVLCHCKYHKCVCISFCIVFCSFICTGCHKTCVFFFTSLPLVTVMSLFAFYYVPNVLFQRMWMCIVWFVTY